jgi:L-seryl-tRNA(Ser) seleniumtransferase
MPRVKDAVRSAMQPKLRRVVNATGVVIHTNLGRSLLAPEAVENLAVVAGRYSNLEYDLAAGRRGSRYMAVRDLLCDITGAEDAMVVNNNAGAVLISLETIARDRNVIVSRGDLVEIGGSFRIPDVMAKSGAILREVGTTNRTHLRDYEGAIDPGTALLLKVHWSNYSIVGFTAQVPLRELVELGARRGIPVMEDLGSGTFIDFSRYGLLKEPTVQESVASGADVVTFSGDKLLGGPQAGIIVGRRPLVESIRKNPINRALRIDKLTLAALESTLRLYRDEARAVAAIPTLRMLTENETAVQPRAEELARRLQAIGDSRLKVEIVRLSSKAGGGSLPLLDLPSRCLKVQVDGLTANQLELKLRRNDPPIIGRIEDGAFLMDARTLQPDEAPIIAAALASVLAGG